MQRYPVRADHRGKLALPELVTCARACFDSAEAEGTHLLSHYGAIERLEAHPEGRELAVELTMNPNVSSEVAGETVQRYNRFLQEVTGYSAKERAKRLRKSATGVPAQG